MFLYNEAGIKGMNFWEYPTDEQLAWVTAKSQEITEGCDTAAEKIFAVVEYVSQNICYDHDYYTHNLKEYDELNLDPYDVLMNETTVCEGYARTSAMLLQIAGVPCIYVDSPNHKWNMAHDGERWILFDTTWISGSRYEYGVKQKSDTLNLKWYDFTIDDANDDANHLIEYLDYMAVDGTLMAFPTYTSFSHVVIPADITVIDLHYPYAMNSQSSYRTLSLPRGLTSVAEFSFRGTLDTIYFQGTKAEYQKISIAEWNNALTYCDNIVYCDNVTAPVVTAHPKDTFAVMDAEITLQAEAAFGDGTVSYQWYVNTSRSTEGGTAISGATGSSYTFTPSALGKSYYYLKISVTDSSVSGVKTASVFTVPCEVYVFEELPSESGKLGPQIVYYKLTDSEIVYIEGNGEITSDVWLYLGNTTVCIDAGITYISEEFIAECCGYAKGYVVESGNPRYAHGESGELYDMTEKKLLSLPYSNPTADFVIPDGIECIAENAITSNNLNTLTMPASLTEIEGGIESELSEIILDEGNTAFYLDDSGALIHKADKKLVKYPNTDASGYVMDEGIREIAPYAFHCSRMSSIELSDSLECIGEYAFYNSGVERVFLPASLTTIGTEAFAYCYNLSDVYFLGDVPENWGYDLFCHFSSAEPVKLHYTEGGKGWSTPTWKDVYDFEYSTALFDSEFVLSGYACGDNAKWSFEDGVLTISGLGDMWDYSWNSTPWYEYGDSIKKIVVKRGITGIGDYAFMQLIDLTEAELPVTLETIGNSAFWNSPDLRKITIPKNVTTIEQEAFRYSYNLTEVYFEGDVPAEWGHRALSDDTDAADITIYYCGDIDSSWDTPEWVSPDELTYKTAPYTVTDDTVTVTGSIVSYGTPDGAITVTLTDTSDDRLGVFTAEDAAFAIEDLEKGSYTLEFRKTGSFPVSTDITAADSDLTVDVTLALIGDVNGDLLFDDTDMDLLTRYFAGHDVSLKMNPADINQDGTVTRSEIMILARYLAGWTEYAGYLS